MADQEALERAKKKVNAKIAIHTDSPRQLLADTRAESAKKRVEAKIGFYIHLTVYVGVNLLLLIINLLTLPPEEQRKGFFQDFWFYWPLLGWGIGVVCHALGVYLSGGSSSFKERMIEKELAKQEAAMEEEGEKEE